MELIDRVTRLEKVLANLIHEDMKDYRFNLRDKRDKHVFLSSDDLHEMAGIKRTNKF